jgi:hypothetical protein
MKKLILLFLLLTAASYKYKVGDAVRFKYTKENQEYSKLCDDFGEVAHILVFNKKPEYMIGVRCKGLNILDYVWVKEKDIKEKK